MPAWMDQIYIIPSKIFECAMNHLAERTTNVWTPHNTCVFFVPPNEQGLGGLIRTIWGRIKNTRISEEHRLWSGGLHVLQGGPWGRERESEYGGAN